jgi:membrane protein involved in D-alanine export
MGLWHGVAWNYILYGLYHATLFVCFDAFARWRKRHPDRLTGWTWRCGAHLLTIHAVIFGLWLFSGQAWQSAEPTAAAAATGSTSPMSDPAVESPSH